MIEFAEVSPDVDVYVKAVRGRKAFDLVMLDVRDLTSVADYFLLCSGRSARQVQAVAEHVKRSLKNLGVKPLAVEGVDGGQWALLDYGDVIIHIFYEPVREFYDLEGFWADAGRIKTEGMTDNGVDADNSF